jgi:hypothetical protein
MKRTLCAAAVLATAFTFTAVAEDGPKLPPPSKEHQWLNQLEGEWTSEVEMFGAPGEPTTKTRGAESARMIGGFWYQGEVKGDDPMGNAFTGILTIGYDPAKKQYVGTWIDSTTSTMWHYTGSVDAAGKTLTLNTEGPNPMDPAKTAKFREVVEVVDKDHKNFTSEMEVEGKWVPMVKVQAARKK